MRNFCSSILLVYLLVGTATLFADPIKTYTAQEIRENAKELGATKEVFRYDYSYIGFPQKVAKNLWLVTLSDPTKQGFVPGYVIDKKGYKYFRKRKDQEPGSVYGYVDAANLKAQYGEEIREGAVLILGTQARQDGGGMVTYTW